MAKPLVVKGWSNSRMSRSPDGMIESDASLMVNEIRTGVCAVCRHRSCATKEGYHTKLKGQCSRESPHCLDAENRLCKALGAPAVQVGFNTKTYDARKTAIEKYLHRMFKRCKPVTITITRGHPDG